MIRFRIDRRTGVAPYLQLVNQVKQAVRLGRLVPGDQLPTARQVVADTAINPNTVFKAYRALESEGLVEAKTGVGTFVTGTADERGSTMDETLRDALHDWLRRCRDAGLTREDVEAVTQDGINETFPHTERK